jgi:hypothetical protein
MRADSRTLGALASLYLTQKDLNRRAFTISVIICRPNTAVPPYHYPSSSFNPVSPSWTAGSDTINA